uniref:Uncharacterized protein n=1 Tax=Arundo donax TaxID=35708 RepID=A0A0A8ZIX9_ARUDO
MMCRRQNRRF